VLRFTRSNSFSSIGFIAFSIEAPQANMLPSPKPTFPLSLNVGPLCRLDRALSDCIVEGRDLFRIAVFGAATTAIGGFAYGFTFGVWRSLEQGFYSAIKLPLLLFAIVLSTALANGIVARLLRAPIGILQGLVTVLLSLGLASTLLGALSPVALYLVTAVPGPLAMTSEALASELSNGDPNRLYRTAQLVLLFHIVVVGACGLVGNIRLFWLLRRMTPSVSVAAKVLASWLLFDAFVGTQLSWILRPFLCKPGLPSAMIRPDALNGNFFEEIWRIVSPIFG
jgi:hypothetical protein